MIALCFLATLALASAAPRFEWHYQERPNFNIPPPPRHPPHRHDGQLSSEDWFQGPVFDTNRFWADLDTEMKRINQMVEDISKRFPVGSTTELKDNKYVVRMNLNGFNEKDIKVKAREGVLMVQAVHTSEDGNQRSQIDLRTLPSYVNVNGTWTYEMGVLEIVFPLNSNPVDVTEIPVTTEAADVDRDVEKMEPNQENTDHDADVGLERGDRDKQTEINSNFIPNNSVEATTYAVDLKDEVEFVPVKY